MSELEYRATPADLEIRGDGRTVVGIAVPYGQPAEIRSAAGSFSEQFARGAFARTIAERGPERVKFFVNHGHVANGPPIGRATLLREDASGLYGEFRVSKTAAGDDALELIRDGALDALSVGFVPKSDAWSNDRRSVTRVEVMLREVSAVAFPAYVGAEIASVRSKVDSLLVSDARAVLERLSPHLSLSEARQRLVSLQRSQP